MWFIFNSTARGRFRAEQPAFFPEALAGDVHTSFTPGHRFQTFIQGALREEEVLCCAAGERKLHKAPMLFFFLKNKEKKKAV